MQKTLAYLDNAASEPLRPEVFDYQQQVWKELGGVGANPSSSHAAGRRASALLETARAQVAQLLGADPAEVLFTGGGTESVALAVAGIAKAKQLENRCFNQVWYSAVEHDSVRQAAQSLPALGISAAELPVDENGVLDLKASWDFNNQPGPAVQRASLGAVGPASLGPAGVGLAGSAGPAAGGAAAGSVAQTASPSPLSLSHAKTGVNPPPGESWPGLVSIMLVCNENGVMQPLQQAKQRLEQLLEQPVAIHSDAIQAVGRMEVNFHQLDIAALSMAGHKIGGPASCGVLLLKRGQELVTDRKGGGQERQIRGGTQDVIAASGLAKALQLAQAERVQLQVTHRRLADKIRQAIAQMAGVKMASQAPTVPGILQLLAADCEAEAMLMAMDQAGVCVSAGSACHTGVARPSRVLMAQGYSEAEALGSIRVSFGWNTDEAQVDRFLQALPGAVEIARKLKQRKTKCAY